MMKSNLKKNCHNCKHGSYQSDGDYCEISWFECDKRCDDGKNNLDENLAKDSYLEKAKTCCDPLFVVKCNVCGGEEKAHFDNKDFVCFVCWAESKNNPTK